MGAINTLPCATGGGNTGVGSCFFDPKNIIGVIITPVGYTIADADITSGLYTKLQADILAPKVSRIYPFLGYVGITDNSEDPTTETLGYGSVEYVREGFNNWLLRFRKGGVCLNAQMRKFNNGAYGILFVDSAGIIFGERISTGLRAVSLETIYTPNWKVNTGSATTIYNTRFVFDATFMNDAPGFVSTADLAFSVRSLTGLQNIALKQGAARAANVLKVKLFAGCSALDLFDDYSAVFATPTVWIVRNAATGNLVNITSVAADPNSRSWALTLDTSDPDYVITANGLNVTLAAPTVLATAGISGYEAANVLVQ